MQFKVDQEDMDKSDDYVWEAVPRNSVRCT